MRKTTLLLAAAAAFLVTAVATSVFAENKEVTITGEGKCAKCCMHESEKCQNVIQAKEDGKTVTYYLKQNKISKEFHENLCKENKQVTATGVVTEKEGKKMLAVSKIELAK